MTSPPRKIRVVELLAGLVLIAVSLALFWEMTRSELWPPDRESIPVDPTVRPLIPSAQPAPDSLATPHPDTERGEEMSTYTAGGDPSPDCTGKFSPAGVYQGKTYYTNGMWYLFFDTEVGVAVFDGTGATRVMILDDGRGDPIVMFFDPDRRQVGGLTLSAGGLTVTIGNASHKLAAALTITDSGEVYLGQFDDDRRPRITHPLRQVLRAQEILGAKPRN